MAKKDCLLITTNDNRNLFTHKKNFSQLIEFSKTMGAEISIVKAENPDILTLEELPPAICNSDYRPKINFQVIKRKLHFIKKSYQIREYIKEMLLKGHVVGLQDITKKFSKLNLSTASFCNHFFKVREDLSKEGYKIEKTGGGKYKIRRQK